jgi:hypothetical protein
MHMAGKKNVWVSPRGDDWIVQREGANRASRVVHRKSEAEDIGRKIARREEVEIIIQRKDGRIQEKDSYGNDPNPPRDTEH